MRHGKHRFIVGFLLVPLGIYTLFVISPFIQAFYYSLTDWTGVSPDFKFIGFDNFVRLAGDELFRTAVLHNLMLLVALPVLTILLALFFAFLLNIGGRSGSGAVRGVRGSGFYKLAFFFPQVLSVPVIAVIWFVIMSSTQDGLLNSVLDPFTDEPLGFLADPNLALACVLWVLVWSTVGFYLVLFNAAISSIPRDIFEAAMLDGAGRAATFFRVTLPLLWDTVQTSWVYLGILALDAWALVVVMTVGPGGPDNATQVMALQITRNGFEFGRASYASAMGVVLFFITLIITVVMLRVTRRERIEY